MQVDRRQGKSLKYLVLTPDAYSPDQTYPLVILLHGFGASMADLAGLCPTINPDGYVYVCPNAPLSIELGPGMAGYAWTSPGNARRPEEAQLAEEMLDTMFEEVSEEFRVEPGQSVLGGFSQGGMMTYRWGLANPDRFRGLVVLSGRVSDPDGIRSRLPASRTQPIFVAHGRQDSMITIEDAAESRSFLEAEGYSPQYKEYPMGHEISQEVLDDLVPWIRDVLTPAGSAPGQ